MQFAAAGCSGMAPRASGGVSGSRPAVPSWDTRRRPCSGGVVLVPRGDVLWEEDIARSTWWLGGVWAAALADLGVDAVVHRGPMEPGRWGAMVCFAGIGPGEVLVAGRKSVGVSQRRDRSGARFQCAALLGWSGHEMVRLLGLVPVEEAEDLAIARMALGHQEDRRVAPAEIRRVDSARRSSCVLLDGHRYGGEHPLAGGRAVSR